MKEKINVRHRKTARSEKQAKRAEDIKKAEQMLSSDKYTPVQYTGHNANIILQHESFKKFNYVLEAILTEGKIIYTVVNTEGKRERLNYPNDATFFINNFEKI